MEKIVFTHEPRAPMVSSVENCTDQRWFLYGYNKCAAGVDVVRLANKDRAKVQISIDDFEGGSSTVAVRMTAQELRVVAMAMIDAANDLETVPAVETAPAVETVGV